MKLDYAILADSAEIIEGGVYVLGGNIDTITAPGFPVIRPSMAMILRLILTPAECNKLHEVQAYFSAPGGNAIEPRVFTTFTAQPHPRHPERGGSVAAVYSFYETTFDVPGIYQGRIVVDDQVLHAVELELVQHTLDWHRRRKEFMALASATTTTVSGLAYVPGRPRTVVSVSPMPDTEACHQEAARAIRRMWMTRMRLSADEIVAACHPGAELLDVDEELANLQALAKLAQLDMSRERLTKLAINP